MNKIIRKLLLVTFPTVGLEELMEVVGATPNPELACEILCGLYSAPDLGKAVRIHKDKSVVTLVSFDKWANTNYQVTYEYQEPVTKSAYFPKGTLKSEVTMETFDKLKVSSSSSDTYYSIPTGEARKTTSTMSVEQWIEQGEVQN